VRNVVATFLKRHLIRNDGITQFNDAIGSAFWRCNSVLENAEA